MFKVPLESVSYGDRQGYALTLVSLGHHVYIVIYSGLMIPPLCNGHVNMTSNTDVCVACQYLY